MKMSTTKKAALFDMVCGTKHVFFVTDSSNKDMSVMFKMNYVSKRIATKSLFANAHIFRESFGGAPIYRARDLKNADEIKAHCLDTWMQTANCGVAVTHNDNVLLPAYTTYEELLVKLDLQMQS